MMVGFVDENRDENRDEHGVESICETLPIAPSVYYLKKAREDDPSKRSAREIRGADVPRSDVSSARTTESTVRARSGDSSCAKASNARAARSNA